MGSVRYRYLRQRDSYSCGPIALLNARKFLRQRVTRADLPMYHITCGTDETGTHWGRLARTVRDTIGLYTAVHEISAPSFCRELLPLLRSGYSLILSLEAEHESHVVFVERAGIDNVFIANWQPVLGGYFDEKQSTHVWVRFSDIMQLVTVDSNMLYFVGWE